MAVPCPPDVRLSVDVTRMQDLTTSKYRVSFTVGATVNIDSHIFVYKQLLSRDAQSGEFESVFEAVSTIQGLADFAVDVPNSGQVFFRKNTLVLEFDSITEAQDTEKLIMTDVGQLVADMREYLAGWQSESVVEI